MTKLMMVVGLFAAVFLWDPPFMLEYVGPKAQMAVRQVVATLDFTRYFWPRG